jgi:hypothetical protein
MSIAKIEKMAKMAVMEKREKVVTTKIRRSSTHKLRNESQPIELSSEKV